LITAGTAVKRHPMNGSQCALQCLAGTRPLSGVPREARSVSMPTMSPNLERRLQAVISTTPMPHWPCHQWQFAAT
jgi:hypothetical protein